VHRILLAKEKTPSYLIRTSSCMRHRTTLPEDQSVGRCCNQPSSFASGALYILWVIPISFVRSMYVQLADHYWLFAIA
jgi:hypothetical protein